MIDTLGAVVLWVASMICIELDLRSIPTSDTHKVLVVKIFLQNFDV